MKDVLNYPLHHVGFVVKDAEETFEGLKQLLGDLKCLRYNFKPMKAYCNNIEVKNYELNIIMVELEGKANIEIIQPVSEGYHMDFTEKTGGGINHICFAVDNYDELHKKFVDSEAKFLFESETEDDVIGYRRCFYAEDSNGNVVEIKENPYFR